jgi:CBS domain-containing protein
MSNEKPQEGSGNIVTNTVRKFVGGSFPNGLAIILILGTITILIVVVALYQATISYNQALYRDLVLTEKINDTNVLNSFQSFYRETTASGTNLLSILLPVFGAWVGAILAFYYGNKNFEKTVDALRTSVEESEVLGRIKVVDVLKQFPNYKEVTSAKITEPIGPKFKESKNSTILLIDEANKPLGFFSEDDVYRDSTIKKDDLMKETKPFNQFIKDNSIVDEITDKKWTESGVKNYAEVSLDDTLLRARERMKNISSKQKVRGLVLNTEGQPVGVITYDLFSEVLASEQKKKSS